MERDLSEFLDKVDAAEAENLESVYLYDQAYDEGYAKAVDEFAHHLKEALNQDFPSNYESTRPYFTLENARIIVDEIAEQMKGGV